METQTLATRMTRRDLLASGTAFGATLVIGAGFVASTTEAWAAKVAHLKPATFATLVQMARDLYPHDKLGDKYYAAAMKAHDTAKSAKMIEDGIAGLNSAAGGSYAGTAVEGDRVAMLKKIESSSFFQTVRGSMITGIYNNPDVWPIFGFEGESFSKGGYIKRGFDDIDWL